MTIAAIKPRKRPVQSRAAGTLDAILEAAARILETRGLAGYTTNAVAARAGVSIGSLYQYFPGKDAITAALLARETALFLASIRPAADFADGRAAMDHLIGASVTQQLRRPALARILDFEEQRLPLADQQGELVAALKQTISDVLGRLNPGQPDAVETIAGDVLAMARGMIDAAGERGETDMPRLQERVARAVYGYIGLEN